MKIAGILKSEVESRFRSREGNFPVLFLSFVGVEWPLADRIKKAGLAAVID